MANPKFASPLEASSNYHPCAPSPYHALRTAAVDTAVSMGYDYDSLAEIPVDWSADQDPNNHVSNPIYAKYASTANMRLFESFATVMGDKYADMLRGKAIGPVLKGYTYNLKRPAAYPDSVLVGNRLSDVRPDRYFTTTTIWSLRQQAVVAECAGWVVFIDFATGRPADLLKAGEPYVSLHAQIKDKVEKANALHAEWEKKHPPKRPSSQL
ncbi:uncharacterized protein BDZ99DRAFT_415588 [Mytilinidion resinicola]|uniref:Thioesterase/thiol ester dehydrase-isomerase n=1 Tax=Mytilinidion resinicola TaxID=574789 RepID=A0A6A6YQG3_9PEZI|nr:uncharacterized protein BDZ99DRAFT_415588 [Mytilinidion resinicola]KAF2811146.1 hypothetical protein BDZ99DRAFT_415588 [Mytilinidion resinicola]